MRVRVYVHVGMCACVCINCAAAGPFYYNTERSYYAETVWNFFKANPLSAVEVDRRDLERNRRHGANLSRSLTK